MIASATKVSTMAASSVSRPPANPVTQISSGGTTRSAMKPNRFAQPSQATGVADTLPRDAAPIRTQFEPGWFACSGRITRNHGLRPGIGSLPGAP